MKVRAQGRRDDAGASGPVSLKKGKLWVPAAQRNQPIAWQRKGVCVLYLGKAFPHLLNHEEVMMTPPPNSVLLIFIFKNFLSSEPLF